MAIHELPLQEAGSIQGRVGNAHPTFWFNLNGMPGALREGGDLQKCRKQHGMYYFQGHWWFSAGTASIQKGGGICRETLCASGFNQDFGSFNNSVVAIHELPLQTPYQVRGRAVFEIP